MAKKLLKPDFLQKLKDDEDLRYLIAKGMNRKMRSIYRWVLVEDSMLTSDAVISIIEKATGLKESDFTIDHPLEIKA